jgi:hypothetical protein
MTLIIQNKPNLPNAQMNASPFITNDYENQPCRPRRDINPIKPNLKPDTLLLCGALLFRFDTEKTKSPIHHLSTKRTYVVQNLFKKKKLYAQSQC